MLFNLHLVLCLLTCILGDDLDLPTNITNSTHGEITHGEITNLQHGVLSVNDGLPDAIAHVGRIFEYSFADNSIFGSSSNQIKVKESVSSNLPKWLLYDSNQRRLVGVPSMQDIRDVYISVETVCQGDSPCFKDVFLLKVVKSQYGFKDINPQTLVLLSNSQTETEIHGCENDIVITNIVFCVSPDKLQSSERLKLLLDMAEFLSLPVTKLMLLSSSGQKLRALEDGFQIVSAGPGNDGLCNQERNFELSWEISCSTLKNLGDFVSILQHNIEVGRIQKESGVGVVGWYIASSSSVKTASHRRRRRRAGYTPVPTSVLSPATPTRVQTTSTIIPTTSYKPDLSRTIYNPGLPTIQIAFRTTESAYASTSKYGYIKPTQTWTPPSVTKYQPHKTTDETPLYTSKSSLYTRYTESTPTSTELVVPTNEIHKGSSNLYTSDDYEIKIHSSEMSSASRMAPGETLEPQTTSVVTSSQIYSYIHSSHDLHFTISESTTGQSDTDHYHIKTSPLLPTDYSNIDTTSHIIPVLPESSSHFTEQSLSQSTPSHVIKESRESLSSTTTETPLDSSIRASSSYEGSATDTIDGSEGSSSASGDQSEEGSTQESGDSGVYTDDEDDVRSHSPAIGPSSTWSPSFSSSLIFLPQPEEGGIVFENPPPDIYLETDDVEPSLSVKDLQSIVPHSSTDVMMSSNIVDLPNRIPLFPHFIEGTGEDTTQIVESSSQLSGSTETIIDEKVLPTSSGQDKVDSYFTERGTTSRADLELTTSKKPTQNIIIEEMESTASSTSDEFVISEKISTTKASNPSTTPTMFSTTPSKFTTTPTMFSTTPTMFSTTPTKSTTTPSLSSRRFLSSTEKSLGSGSFEEQYTTERTSEEVKDRTTSFGVLFGEDSRPTSRSWYQITESTTNSLPRQTSQPVTEMSTEFSWVTNRQNNRQRKKNKNKNKKKNNKKKNRKKNRNNKTTTVGYWDWKTLPYNVTTALPPTKWPSLPGERNQKPYLENSVDYIDATLGEYFEFPIPRNVFYDIEDGDTKSLELSLSLPYNQALPPTFWLQLDSRRQIIKGLPLAVDMDTGYHNINLIARDSGGLTETDSIKLHVNSSSFEKFTHRFIMTFGVDFAKFMNNRNNLNSLLQLIASYYGDEDVNHLTVMDVSVGSLILTWTNNSLGGDHCDNNSISNIYSRMVRRDGSIRTSLNRHFGKNLPIQELEYQPYGACADTSTTVVYTTFLPEKAEETGLSIWAQVVLPVMVSLLVILLIVLLVLLINRRRKKKPEPAAWDKPVFNNDRNPIIFPDELEREESNLKPKKPTTLASDVSGSLSSAGSRNSRPYYYFEDDPESNNSTLNSERSRTGSNKRPPKAPPPYWQPHSEPPPYRLPPPYVPQQQTNV